MSALRTGQLRQCLTCHEYAADVVRTRREARKSGKPLGYIRHCCCTACRDTGGRRHSRWCKRVRYPAVLHSPRGSRTSRSTHGAPPHHVALNSPRGSTRDRPTRTAQTTHPIRPTRSRSPRGQRLEAKLGAQLRKLSTQANETLHQMYEAHHEYCDAYLVRETEAWQSQPTTIVTIGINGDCGKNHFDSAPGLKDYAVDVREWLPHDPTRMPRGTSLLTQSKIMEQPGFKPLFDVVNASASVREITVIYCSAGHHRSVAVGEILQKHLVSQGKEPWAISLIHADTECDRVGYDDDMLILTDWWARLGLCTAGDG